MRQKQITTKNTGTTKPWQRVRPELLDGRAGSSLKKATFLELKGLSGPLARPTGYGDQQLRTLILQHFQTGRVARV